MAKKHQYASVSKLYKCAFPEFENQIPDPAIISDGEYEAVKFALNAMLTEKEYEVITLWFGFLDGKSWPYEAISFHTGLPLERIHQIKAKAIRKILASKTKLPCLFVSEDDEAVVDNLIFQLNVLHNDSVFKREAELRTQLREFSDSPFTYAEKATAYLAGRNETDLSRIGLNVPAYNCLSHAGITTIADVIDYPKTEWPKIKTISEKIIREVEKKMQAAGFANFRISE